MTQMSLLMQRSFGIAALDDMLEAFELAMSWVRRIGLYVTLGALLAASFAIAIVKVTEQILISFARVGNSITDRLAMNDLLALVFFTGIGYFLWSKLSKEQLKFDVPTAVGSFGFGAIAFAVFFWLLPGLAHALAVDFLAPLLNLLAAFLKGEIAVSIKLFGKLLFLIYLVLFMLDLLIQHYAYRRAIAPSVDRMLSKYWKELLEVITDIFDVLMLIPKFILQRKAPPPE